MENKKVAEITLKLRIWGSGTAAELAQDIVNALSDPYNAPFTEVVTPTNWREGYIFRVELCGVVESEPQEREEEMIVDIVGYGKPEGAG